MAVIVELKAAGRTFRQGLVEVHALRPTDLGIGQGELIAVTGRSGSGKSTLLNLITGIDRPSTGTVIVDGVDLTRLSENRLASFRGTRIGIVFQFFELIPTLTVLENVILPMDLVGGVPAGDRKNAAIRLLDRLGVGDQASKLPSRLSGGQQQRVAIARALANNPPILVADEPTGNLDTANSEMVFDIFRELAAEGRTIVIATHEIGGLERFDRALHVVDGVVSAAPAKVAA